MQKMYIMLRQGKVSITDIKVNRSIRSAAVGYLTIAEISNVQKNTLFLSFAAFFNTF